MLACFCGNSIVNDQAVVSGATPDNGCNMPSRGNVLEYCGGAKRITIYQARINILTNGDFKISSSHWQVANHPSCSASNLVSGGSAVTSAAESGRYGTRLGDLRVRLRRHWLPFTFYHPHTGS
ncbi:hypothetical protein PMIN03_000392 [Paraphaeosphaeria minitans]